MRRNSCPLFHAAALACFHDRPSFHRPRDKAEILAQALPYIRKFHGKTMVIKLRRQRHDRPDCSRTSPRMWCCSS